MPQGRVLSDATKAEFVALLGQQVFPIATVAYKPAAEVKLVDRYINYVFDIDGKVNPTLVFKTGQKISITMTSKQGRTTGGWRMQRAR